MIQPPGGLFTQAGDPVPEYWVDNLHNLREFIDGFYEDHELQSGITYVPLLAVQGASEKVLGANVLIRTPSVFKQAAAFTLGFLQESPLTVAFTADSFDEQLAKIAHIENHQNAIVGFEYARFCLHGAAYIRNGQEIILKNRITVSHHFYSDLIFSLSTLPKKQMPHPSSFHEMALLYESLAYQDNPEGSYPRIF